MIAKFDSVLSKYKLRSLDSTFDLLVGIRDYITSETVQVYREFGNIYAEFLGICGEKAFLTNSNAMITYASILPPLEPSRSVVRQLGSLTHEKNIHVSVEEVAKKSDIIDALMGEAT